MRHGWFDRIVGNTVLERYWLAHILTFTVPLHSPEGISALENGLRGAYSILNGAMWYLLAAGRCKSRNRVPRLQCLPQHHVVVAAASISLTRCGFGSSSCGGTSSSDGWCGCIGLPAYLGIAKEGSPRPGFSAFVVGCLRRPRRKKAQAMPARAKTPIVTPTPMPALAPVLSPPDEPLEEPLVAAGGLAVEAGELAVESVGVACALLAAAAIVNSHHRSSWRPTDSVFRSEA